MEVTKRVDLPWFGPITRTSILDHDSLAVLVRTAALNANVFLFYFLCIILVQLFFIFIEINTIVQMLSILQQETKSEYVSNLELRFKQIKTIKERYAKDGNEY